jgi:DNA-binding MarR family transcriptional regulator
VSEHVGQPRNLQEEVARRRPFDDPAQEAYLNLLRTHAVLSREFDQLFRAHGLSSPQYNALRIIAGAGEDGIRSESIGELMIAQDPDTTRLVDRLERAGLVRRQRWSDDRRVVLVRATDAGRRVLDGLLEQVSALHGRQLAHMRREDVEALSRLLFEARHPRA